MSDQARVIHSLDRDNLLASAGVRISVIIPAHNSARFLPRCLKSAFGQTLKATEVIVVDDGSTDNTAGLARELGAQVIVRANGGVSAARNTGIHSAQGDWIAFLDADDEWEPEKLKAQAALIQSDVVLIYTGTRIFDDNRVRGTNLATEPSRTTKTLRYGNPITTSSVIARRDALIRAGGFREDLTACEDWELWVRLQRVGRFDAVPEALTGYYVHPTSLSADPQRMVDTMEKVIDSTLVSDLNGLNRWAWKQRIRAVQMCSAALVARDNGIKGELGYMLRSLLAWPSPFWEPRRFAIAAVSILSGGLRPSRVKPTPGPPHAS